MSQSPLYMLLTDCAYHTGTAPLYRYTAALCGFLHCHKKAFLLHLDILLLQGAAFYRNCILWCHTFGISLTCHHYHYRCIDCLQSCLFLAVSLTLLGFCPHHRYILCIGYHFSGTLWCCQHCIHILLSFYCYPTLHGYCLSSHNSTLSFYLSHLSDV